MMSTKASAYRVNDRAEPCDELTQQIREYLQRAGDTGSAESRRLEEFLDDNEGWSEKDDDDAIEYTG